MKSSTARSRSKSYRMLQFASGGIKQIPSHQRRFWFGRDKSARFDAARMSRSGRMSQSIGDKPLTPDDPAGFAASFVIVAKGFAIPISSIGFRRATCFRVVTVKFSSQRRNLVMSRLPALAHWKE
jgi:hypothetical protein